MVLTRFVEVGRIVHINLGRLAGRLAIIVDIININRVLIEGPSANVKRQEISVSQLSLTDIVVPLRRGANSKEIRY